MPQAQKQSVEIRFPAHGVVEGAPHSAQPPGTTPDAKNVRPFDTEEDRIRGGRRDGVSKITGSAISSSKVDYIGNVNIASTSTSVEVGGTSHYDSNHPEFPDHEGILDFRNLSDGSALTEGNINHLFYCRSRMGMNPSGGFSAWPDRHHALGCNPLFEKAEKQNNRITPMRNLDRSGLTKKSDDDGVPYVSFNPAACRLDYGCLQDGSPKTPMPAWKDVVIGDADIDTTEAVAGFGSINQTLVFKKLITLMPKTDFDQQPWNSEKTQKFATSMTFIPPLGYPNINVMTGGDDEGWVEFVKTADDVTNAEKEIYDPYYSETVSMETGVFDADDHRFKLRQNISNTGDTGFDPCYRWGIIFRIRFDLDAARSGDGGADPYWENWCKNSNQAEEDEQSRAFVIYFEKSALAESATGKSTHLMAGELRSSTSALAADARRGFSPEGVVTLAADVFDPLDTGKHTLDIRADGNAFTVFVDGKVEYTTTDINIDFPLVGPVAASESLPRPPTQTKKSFCHTMMFYALEYSVSRKESISDTPGKARRCLDLVQYFGAYDWTLVGDSSGDTVSDAQKGSDELRLYDWTWRDVNTTSGGRDVLVAVSNGYVYDAPPVSMNSFRLTEGTQPLDSNVRRTDGVEFFQKHYFVDGNNYKEYDPSTRTTADWDATGEVTLPGGDGETGSRGEGTSDGNSRCSIITKFSGRIVMSGKEDEPQNWFMSAFGDANDWDIDSEVGLGGAVSGASGPLGEVADAVTALAPSGDTKLVIGASNSMYTMTGDPGGPDTQLITTSRDIGIVGPDAWCYGPNRILYFMSENGFYAIQPNEYNVSQTNRLSAGKLDRTFRATDFGTVHARLVYDHVNHGVHVFLTPTRLKEEAQAHHYYDSRTDSFWPMEYPAVIGPTYVYDYKNVDPELRSIMLGGYDGHIRKFDTDGVDDDGTAIDSHVWIGPITLSSIRETKLTELVAILDEQTPGLSYEVYAADTVEQAKSGTPVFTGSWIGGRNTYVRSRARGAAIFIKLLDGTSQAPWALERLSATLAVAGRARTRS